MSIRKKISIFTMLLVMIISFMTPVYVKASDSVSNMTPIHVYNFDNDTGVIVQDSITSSAINGTINGTSRVNGYNGTGNAIHFDGNSYIKFSGSVIPVGKKHISFKIRKEKATGKVEYIFGNANSYSDDYGTSAFIFSDGKIGFENANASSGSSFTIMSKNNICDNKWHDILYTWDGTKGGIAQLYVDDMSIPNNTTIAKFDDVNIPTYNLYIGTLAGVVGPKFLGDLDEFVVSSDLQTVVALKVVLEVKEKLQLSVDEDLAENIKMTWSSSNTAVATVDANGEVTALAPGNTIVTVISADGTYTDYINVLVVEDAKDYRLAVDLKVGKSCRLTVDDLTDTVNVNWASLDPTVAIVSSKGKVTAVDEGLTVVIATDDNGNEIGQIYIRVRK